MEEVKVKSRFRVKVIPFGRMSGSVVVPLRLTKNSEVAEMVSDAAGVVAAIRGFSKPFRIFLDKTVLTLSPDTLHKLLDTFHDAMFPCLLYYDGSVDVSQFDFDWVAVIPENDREIVQTSADEVIIRWRTRTGDMERFDKLYKYKNKVIVLDSAGDFDLCQDASDFVSRNPDWVLSFSSEKELIIYFGEGIFDGQSS